MNSLFNFDQLKTALGCETLGRGVSKIRDVSIDSRTATKSSLFIPLVGEVTDGNLFIEGALKNGCRSTLMSYSFYNGNLEVVKNYLKTYKCTIFLVEDGLMALHTLARVYIDRFPNLVVVGITGSSGKTSTKEVLGSILSSFDTTLVTKGNYNSETGLPLTVFRIKKKHRFAVIEMGMSKPGEIKALVNIVNPYAAIITNIGRAHIGAFDSIDGIAREKKDVFSNFSGDNLAIVPGWDSFSDYLGGDINGEVISVNRDPEYIKDVKDLGFNGWEFIYEDKKVHYPYIGQYNLSNAYLAIACARELGVSSEAIVKGLEGVRFLFGRGEILEGENRVIRDCYNANPDSTISSLELLYNTNWSGDKVAILGDMLELGETSFMEHLKVLTYGRELSLSNLILYGGEYKKVYESLEDRSGILFCKDFEALVDVVNKRVKANSLILLKASRGVKLEEITEYIL